VKIPESDMPAEAYWSSFFDPEQALRDLGCVPGVDPVVEFGCGYGTFTIEAAKLTMGKVFALDIDPEMIDYTSRKANRAGLGEIALCTRDFVERDTNLEDGSCGYAMLFNILHLEQPVELLKEAYRVLRPGGIVAIMHWNYDPATPRGPSMDIRPRPEQCLAWAQEAGFQGVRLVELTTCPFHYGILGNRPA